MPLLSKCRKFPTQTLKFTWCLGDVFLILCAPYCSPTRNSNISRQDVTLDPSPTTRVSVYQLVGGDVLGMRQEEKLVKGSGEKIKDFLIPNC